MGSILALDTGTLADLIDAVARDAGFLVYTHIGGGEWARSQVVFAGDGEQIVFILGLGDIAVIPVRSLQVVFVHAVGQIDEACGGLIGESDAFIEAAWVDCGLNGG